MVTRAPRSSESEQDHGVVPDSEINAWVERERERRRQWLEGPTEEEKEAWARRERRRRREAIDSRDSRDEADDEYAEGHRLADRWGRDVAFALAGLASRLVDSPYRMLDTLIRDGRELAREGREWDDSYRAPTRRRPRVRLDDDD